MSYGWKSRAEDVLKRVFDDPYGEHGPAGKIFFSGEEYLLYAVPRELLEEIHSIIDRDDGAEEKKR